MGSVPVRVVPARFVDQLFEITDRVLFRDYSAEKFAFGRVATELDSAARRAGLSSRSWWSKAIGAGTSA